MMRFRGKAPNKAEREFLEWASLFDGSLFVNLVAYADESGTHDPTGVQKGSRQAIIGGMVAPVEEWATFRRQWQAALNKYNAPYFHFYEWSEASSVAREKRKPSSSFLSSNPYRKWNQATLDRFLVELATIAGSGNKIIVGVAVSADMFHAAQKSGTEAPDANPYEQCADKFFASVVESIGTQKPPWKRMPLSFFFDQTGNSRFINTVTQMFLERKKQYYTFKGIAFEDKKENLPLQAADMVAYRARQITENWVDGKDRDWEAVDSVLFKSLHAFVDHHGKEFMQAYFSGALDYPPKPSTPKA